MKKQLESYWLLLALAGICIGQAHAGTEGHGGDIQCDAQIKSIAGAIQEWIVKGGTEAGPLDLSSSQMPGANRAYTLSEYDAAMKALLALPLDASCVSEGQPEYPVAVDGSVKVCKNSVDGGVVHMVCDRALFTGLSDAEKIQQIHHEFATDIVGLETDSGPISTYKVSLQLSDLVKYEREPKLAVREIRNPFKKFVGSYVVVSQQCTQDGKPWTSFFGTADNLVVEDRNSPYEFDEGIWINRTWSDGGNSGEHIVTYPNTYGWLQFNGFEEGESFAELRISGDDLTAAGKKSEKRIRITKNEDATFTLLESDIDTDKATGAFDSGRICNTVFRAKN